ncbi:MAG TPA: putative dsRNA-binding protein [Solirubrobacteraceae bacterium]|nr:putative dsRNA-binding protein [Solirubrobacteraceae bacterium]
MATEDKPAITSVARLRVLLDELPPDLAVQVFTHASWTTKRAGSYERLAFLGDSVLSLAITSHLYPTLEEERFGAGELTKIRAQTVSGRSCRVIAELLDVPSRVAAVAPPGAAASVPALVSTERVLASITEAIIGACYLAFGYERVATAVVEAFEPLLADALEHPVDFKSALQERLARRGALVSYEVVEEEGPPHDRTFTIVARIGSEEIGRGVGRSKKDAEQQAARAALTQMDTTAGS